MCSWGWDRWPRPLFRGAYAASEPALRSQPERVCGECVTIPAMGAAWLDRVVMLGMARDAQAFQVSPNVSFFCGGELFELDNVMYDERPSDMRAAARAMTVLFGYDD